MAATVRSWCRSPRLYALFSLFSLMSLFAFVGEESYRWTYLTYLSFLLFLLYLPPRHPCPFSNCAGISRTPDSTEKGDPSERNRQ